MLIDFPLKIKRFPVVGYQPPNFSISYLVISLYIPQNNLRACAIDEEDISPLHVRSIAQVLGYTGDPTTNRTLPSINDPKAQLGKKLSTCAMLRTCRGEMSSSSTAQAASNTGIKLKAAARNMDGRWILLKNKVDITIY